MKILITSGGCKVPVDQVRHIGNFSSGRYGAELADALSGQLSAGDRIVFFHERGSRKPTHDHTGILIKEYRDYWGYLDVVPLAKQFRPDIIISAAAISDYVLDPVQGKISSSEEQITLTLTKGRKVIQDLRRACPTAVLVGFKLLVSPTTEQKAAAINKLGQHGANMVVYNDLTELRAGNAARELYFLNHPRKKWEDSFDGIQGSHQTHLFVQDLAINILGNT